LRVWQEGLQLPDSAGGKSADGAHRSRREKLGALNAQRFSRVSQSRTVRTLYHARFRHIFEVQRPDGATFLIKILLTNAGHFAYLGLNGINDFFAALCYVEQITVVQAEEFLP
jgi:hypothetical protein